MRILDFGSLNLDNVFQVRHLVKKGETLRAEKTEKLPGGKGLNQAIAAARAGSEVWMAGNVGFDGGDLLRILNKNEIHTDFVRSHPEENSGRAIIEINPEGDNSILYDPGANERCDPAQIVRVFAHFHPGDYLICQNEISSMDYLLSTARRKGFRIVFNPSPLSPALLDWNLDGIAVVAVNEYECSVLTGLESASPQDLCRAFLRRWPLSGLLLTLGSQGSMFARKTKAWFMPSFPTRVVDTTGAGDTYLGYFTDGLARGMDIGEAMRRASAAAALAIGKKGAAVAIPDAKEVSKFLKKNELKAIPFDLWENEQPPQID